MDEPDRGGARSIVDRLSSSPQVPSCRGRSLGSPSLSVDGTSIQPPARFPAGSLKFRTVGFPEYGFERPQGAKNRRQQSTWAFAELGCFVTYKARLAGGFAIQVDADYTSKACPHCGHVSDRNHPGKELTFHCEHCGFTLHADLVGARNVTLRTLLIRQDWIGTGLLSAAPDGSADEAKAKRLERFLELRWRSNPSLVL